jgi:hypothetical protein
MGSCRIERFCCVSRHTIYRQLYALQRERNQAEENGLPGDERDLSAAAVIFDEVSMVDLPLRGAARGGGQCWLARGFVCRSPAGRGRMRSSCRRFDSHAPRPSSIESDGVTRVAPPPAAR